MKPHPWRTHIFFIVLVLLGFSLRLINFSHNYRFDHGDVARDYLVAHHIVAYHEFPTIGPVNSIYTELPNSHFYYYVLAIPVFFHDSIMSLAVFNVILQLVIVISLYGLAYVLFGPHVGLLSAILILFNQQVISQTDMLWQAYVTQAWLYTSYFLLALGYTKKTFRWIWISSVCFMTSLGMSYYPVPAVPGYLLILLYVLKKIQTPIRNRYFLISIMGIMGVLLYLPTMVHMWTIHQPLFFVIPNFYTWSLSQFLQRIVENNALLLSGWMHTTWFPPDIRSLTLLYILTITAYYLIKKRTKKRLTSVLIMTFVAQLVVIASYLTSRTAPWHFSAGLGLVIVLFSQVTLSVWPPTLLGHIGKVSMICTLILLTLPTPGYIHKRFTQINNTEAYTAAFNTMLKETKTIQSTFPSDWPRRVSIERYNKYNHLQYDMFWQLLEIHTNTKLTRIGSTLAQVFVPIYHETTYTFIICEDYQDVADAIKLCVPRHDAKLIYDGSGRDMYTVFITYEK